MTISVANTANTNSFYYWLTRTNELAYALSNYVVTTGSNNTTGNAYVNGVFSSTTLTANSGIRGGNVSTSTVLTVTSNLNVTGTQLSVGSNITMNSSSLSIGNSTINTTINSTSIGISGYTVSSINVQISTLDSQIVDSFDKTAYRTAEYVISIKNNSANGYQTSKLLLIHDTGDAYVTEYGVISTNTTLGTFSANVNSSNCNLLFTPTVANIQIKGVRTNVVV